MTKKYKKQERLSVQARELLEIVRRTYAHDPVKGSLYLYSFNRDLLTMYDKQKIGREILARTWNASRRFDFKGLDARDFEVIVGEEYGAKVKGGGWSARNEQSHPERAKDRKYDSNSVLSRALDAHRYLVMRREGIMDVYNRLIEKDKANSS